MRYSSDVIPPATTLLWQLGMDPRRLEIPGRIRLEIDFGQPIREIMA